MKLYAMSDLLQNADSRYLLVNAVAHRAREIAVQAEADKVSLEEKPVTMAMEEAVRGELKVASQQLQEEAEEIAQETETEQAEQEPVEIVE